MENKMFDITNDELMEVDGGIAITTVLLIIAGGTMVVSAGVSAFNGYQEARRENEE